MQVTIRRFPCARVRAFVHVERVFEAACGIGDDLVEPVLLAEVCQREAVCPHLHQCPAEPGDGDGIAQSFRRRRLASQRAAGEAAARARHPGGQATF